MRVKKVDWAMREACLLNLHRAAAEEWSPNEAHICGYGQPSGGGGRDMVSLSPTYFDISVNNREESPLTLTLQRHLVGEGVTIACGLLAFTVPKWITVTVHGDGEKDAAQFAACKCPGEEEWVDLCILEDNGEMTVSITLTIDSVLAMEEFGLDNYRTEARLRQGAQTLDFQVDAAANEEEVFIGAGRLLKSNGEENAETYGTLCMRCRRVPRDGQEPATHPLDVYVPIKLFLGSDDQREQEEEEGR